MKTRQLLWAALMAVAAFSMKAQAQNMSIATLQHETTMQAFYGSDAFIEALDAAQTGDVISLSSGNFNAPDSITKAVTIQGAGMQLATLTEFPTYIQGKLVVSLPDGESGLILEGLSISYEQGIEVKSGISNFSVVKCRMQYLQMSDEPSQNILVDRCFVLDNLNIGGRCNGMLIKNTRTRYLSPGSESNYNVTVENCVMDSNDIIGKVVGVFRNNIMQTMKGDPSSLFYNNLYRWSYDQINGEGNMIHDGFGDILYGELPTSNANNQYTYILYDEPAAKFLGTDGTQVGMYGGITPFTVVPSCPQVTKKEIAGQSDSNGKLSIKVTVETPNN